MPLAQQSLRESESILDPPPFLLPLGATYLLLWMLLQFTRIFEFHPPPSGNSSNRSVGLIHRSSPSSSASSPEFDRFPIRVGGNPRAYLRAIRSNPGSHPYRSQPHACSLYACRSRRKEKKRKEIILKNIFLSNLFSSPFPSPSPDDLLV